MRKAVVVLVCLVALAGCGEGNGGNPSEAEQSARMQLKHGDY